MQLTVVVPMFNAESTILECLRSIGAQTKPAARIIVVDDNSTDRSVEIVRRARLLNVEVMSLPDNYGPGTARNFGAAQATTEWLAFLDADDVWRPTFLEAVCSAIVRHGADFGSSGGIRHLEYRDRPATSVRLLGDSIDDVDMSQTFWRTAMRFMPIHPSSAVIRRDLFQFVGGFCEEVRNGEDISLWAGLWSHGRFAFVNRPLFISIAPPTGLSARRLAYADVRKPLRLVAGSAWYAARHRKAGTGWLLVWFGAAVVRRHGTWLVRRGRRSPGALERRPAVSA